MFPNALANLTVFYMTFGVSVRTWKSRLLTLSLHRYIRSHSIISEEIYFGYFHIIIYVVYVGCKMSEWKRGNRNMCMQWNGMELTVFGSCGSSARSQRMPQSNLIWISKRISYFGDGGATVTAFGLFSHHKHLNGCEGCTPFCVCAHKDNSRAMLNFGTCVPVYCVNFNSTEKKIHRKIRSPFRVGFIRNTPDSADQLYRTLHFACKLKRTLSSWRSIFLPDFESLTIVVAVVAGLAGCKTSKCHTEK